MLGEHRHILNTMEKIEHQILRDNCKRKADDSISIRPSKIIRSELMATDFEVPYSNIKSIRKAMYDKRRKNYPPFLDLLTCAILQLRKMEENGGIKFKKEKCVHAPDDLQYICITTKTNINVLLQYEDVFVDGTFEYAPMFSIIILSLFKSFLFLFALFVLIDMTLDTFFKPAVKNPRLVNDSKRELEEITTVTTELIPLHNLGGLKFFSNITDASILKISLCDGRPE
ncbi:hypothetical protein QTP88_024666 [Uroleucon formosanum]